MTLFQKSWDDFELVLTWNLFRTHHKFDSRLHQNENWAPDLLRRIQFYMTVWFIAPSFGTARHVGVKLLVEVGFRCRFFHVFFQFMVQNFTTRPTGSSLRTFATRLVRTFPLFSEKKILSNILPVTNLKSPKIEQYHSGNLIVFVNTLCIFLHVL